MTGGRNGVALEKFGGERGEGILWDGVAEIELDVLHSFPRAGQPHLPHRPQNCLNSPYPT